MVHCSNLILLQPIIMQISHKNVIHNVMFKDETLPLIQVYLTRKSGQPCA